MLPADLHGAESQTLQALEAALAEAANGRWSVEWRFSGLRLLPPVLRLLAALGDQGRDVILLVSDAGGAALARRDAPEQAGQILDFRQLQQRQQQQPSTGLLLALAPAPADYETFETLCSAHSGAVVMVNGNLEDAAVGIGSVARQRRRGFVAQWQSAYALIPQSGAALRRAFPQPWELYRQDPDGFRFVRSFESKPDTEAQAEALGNGSSGGVAGTLRAVDALVEGLRN
jgi:hypothetical protein